MANLTEQPLSSLLSMVSILNSEIVKLELADQVDQTKVDKLTTKLEPYNLEIMAREKAEKDANAKKEAAGGGKESKHDPDTAIRQEDRQVLTEMRSQIESIPVFGPGSDLTLFLTGVENVYSIFVKSNRKFEANFLRMVEGRLAQAFLTRVCNQTPAIDTYDKLKKYLEQHHGSKKTCYQQLDELYDIEPSANQMRDYAIQLENACNDLYIKLADKFSKEDKTFDARAMLDLVGAQIYVRNLKHHAPVACYNSIVNSLSSCWDVNSVATHAQSYLERVVKEDDLTAPNAFFGGRTKQKPANKDKKKTAKGDKKEKKKGICFKWRDTGECKYKNCWYDHPPRDELNQRDNEESNGQYVLKPMPGFQNGSLSGADQ